MASPNALDVAVSNYAKVCAEERAGSVLKDK